MRIVHVVEALGTGGLERIVQTLVRHGRDRGLDMHVVCAAAGGPIALEIEASGTPVRLLSLGGYRPADVLRAARVLAAIRPDVVHSHGHLAGILTRSAAWWAGVPARVHHLHTIDTTLRARHRTLERILAGVTDRILCCSEAVAEHARRDLGIAAARIRVVPNGIEPPPDSDRAAARRLLGEKDGTIIGCLGSLTPHKGQAVLLRAIDLLGDRGGALAVALIGDGPERRGLENLARGLRRRPRVLFLGVRQDARLLLPAFDLLAIPSLEKEGFGLAAIEAQDAGVPVVASRVGGLPETLDQGRTGLLVPAGDPAALASGIERILDHPGETRTRVAAGRARVEERFRAARMSRTVQEIYEEVAHARRAA